jgi:hypothetical protein
MSEYLHGYAQRRSRNLTPEEFVARWRQHFELARSFVDYWRPVRRYVQNDVLDGGFDAVGEFFYENRAARDAVANVPRAALFADGAELFDVDPPLFFGGEYSHLHGRKRAPYKLFRLLQDADSVVETQLGVGAAVVCGDDPSYAVGGAVIVWLDDPAGVAAVDAALPPGLTLLARERVLQG